MQDIPAVSQGFESILLPERDLIVAFPGHPGQVIDVPTPAQRLVFGPTRRRIPEPWSVDDPAATGLPLGNDARTQAAAAHSLFFGGHLPGIADAAFDEFYRLTGRRYERVGAYRVEDASYLIIARGGLVPLAEAVADYFRQAHRIKVGVADLTLCRPFPGERLSHLLAKRKGVVVLEAAPPSLCGDPPLLLEVRAVVGKCLENGQAKGGELPFPEYAAYGRLVHAPPLHSALYGAGPSTPTAEDLIGAVQNMLPAGSGRRQLALSCDFHREPARSPKEEIYLQSLADAYPQIKGLGVKRLGKQGGEHPHLLPKNAVTMRMYAVAGREIWGPNEHLGRTLFELTGLQVKARALPNQVRPGHSVAFHLVAAQDPIRCDGVDAPVDLVLVTDPRLFRLANPLAGLKDEGTLILQVGQLDKSKQGEQSEQGEKSEVAYQEDVWNDLPPEISKEIRERRIQAYAIDALTIAAEEDSPPELLDLTIGKVFQGCALVTPALARLTRLSGKHLVRALREVLRKRNEEEELQTAEDELRVFQRGMEELIHLAVPGAESAVPIAEGAVPGAEGAVPLAENTVPPGRIALPKLLKDWPVHPTPALNLHRLWAEGGVAHGRAVGEGENASLLAEPLLASGVTPAASALLRDVSVLRSSFPRWVPESCTGCGACWMV
ncbi:MAG: 2-oxoacid:acceptor oxidoreductase family protein, partial [bacterium]